MSSVRAAEHPPFHWADAAGPPAAPAGHHHMAWVTYDIEATVEFYVRILRTPLVNAVSDDRIPSTGEPLPYIHIFFRLADGTTLAFFEAPGVPPQAPPVHPAHIAFNHVALAVPGREEIRQWHRWLTQNGVDVIEHDHGIIHSLYFFDPNGIRLEITTTIDPRWNDREDEAASAVTEWIAAKNAARARGSDVNEALADLARAAAQRPGAKDVADKPPRP